MMLMLMNMHSDSNIIFNKYIGPMSSLSVIHVFTLLNKVKSNKN